MVHEVSVVAEPPGVLLLVCSCGSLRDELPDFEMRLLDVTERAAAHVEWATVQEQLFAHLERGHVQRAQESPAGMVMACSCEAQWPLAVAV